MMLAAPRHKLVRTRSLSDAEFRNKAKAAEAARGNARGEGVRAMGSAFIDVLEQIAPTDTNRWLRAYQIAGNDAGLPTRAVLPVKESSRRQEWIDALESQVRFWLDEAERYDRFIGLYQAEDARHPTKNNGEPRARRTATKSYRDYVRRRDRAKREAEKSERTLAEALGSEGFLLFDKGGFARGRAERFGKSGKRFRTSIRSKVYGGRGEIVQMGDVAVVKLHNLEPHASIVAKSSRHGRPVSYALAAVRALGGREITGGYARAMAKVTGWDPKGRSTRVGA